MTERVLLTGISGFVGAHVALALLDAGYGVRGSVRSLDKAQKVRETLVRAGADPERLEFVALDLLKDEGWAEAMAGCRYLQHTASPFVLRSPRDRNDLIRPAVEGTRRAVAAALANGVERVVLTSSIAAIAYGHGARTTPYSDADWTRTDGPGVSAYSESKTRAEREAWTLMDAADRHEDLATINPGVILGPLLDDDPGTSATLVLRLLKGSVPLAPPLAFGYIDVRDVAALHLAAMQSPSAGGQRHIGVERTASLLDIAAALRPAFPDRARRLPRHELPDWLIRAYGLFDPDVANLADELGIPKRYDARRAIALLGRPFIPTPDAAIATGRSLIANGLLG